jgi:hypothetical protein
MSCSVVSIFSVTYVSMFLLVHLCISHTLVVASDLPFENGSRKDVAVIAELPGSSPGLIPFPSPERQEMGKERSSRAHHDKPKLDSLTSDLASQSPPSPPYRSFPTHLLSKMSGAAASASASKFQSFMNHPAGTPFQQRTRSHLTDSRATPTPAQDQRRSFSGRLS